jgi:hypothetical protein
MKIVTSTNTTNGKGFYIAIIFENSVFGILFGKQSARRVIRYYRKHVMSRHFRKSAINRRLVLFSFRQYVIALEWSIAILNESS